MADQNSTIKTKVVLDATQAQQEIAKLNATASDSTQKLEDRVAAKNKAVELQNKLSKQNVDNLKKEVDALKKGGAELKVVEKAETKLNKAKVTATKQSVAGAKAQAGLNEKLRESKSATANLDKGMGGLLSKMKLLAANPLAIIVGLITTAFLALRKAMNSSEEGQNKLAKAGAVLSSVFGNLLDLISVFANKLFDVFTDPKQAVMDLADAIKENIMNRFEGLLELIPQLGKAIGQLFSGDFAEAAETAANAVGKVVLGVDDVVGSIKEAGQALADFSAEVSADAKIAADIAAQRAKADKLERDLIVDQAKAVRDIAELRDKLARRDKFTREERLEFAKEAAAINAQIAEQETRAAQIRYDAIVAENALSNSDKAALDAEAAAKAKLYELDAKRLKLQKALGSELSILNLEAVKEAEKLEAAAIKADLQKEAQRIKDEEAFRSALERKNAALLEADEIEKERLILAGENTLLIEQEILTKKMEMELAALDLSEQEKANIRKKYGIEQEKLVQETGDATTKIDKVVGDQKVQAAMAIGNAIANLATTLFEDNKAAQIGAVGIQTITGAAGAFAASSGAYPAPFGPILGGISAAAVVAGGVKAIADISASKPGKRGQKPRISSPTAAATAPTTSAIGDIGANNSARLGVDPNIGNAATANASGNARGGASNQVQFSEEKYNDFQGQVAFKEEKTVIG